MTWIPCGNIIAPADILGPQQSIFSPLLPLTQLPPGNRKFPKNRFGWLSVLLMRLFWARAAGINLGKVKVVKSQNKTKKEQEEEQQSKKETFLVPVVFKLSDDPPWIRRDPFLLKYQITLQTSAILSTLKSILLSLSNGTN